MHTIKYHVVDVPNLSCFFSFQGSETSSTSSSLEFVQLEENACSAIFQRRESERHEHKGEENLEPNIAAEDEEPFDTQESIEDLGPQLIPGRIF